MFRNKIPLFSLFWGTILCAQPVSLNVPYLTEAPVIDGNLQESAWKDIPWQSGFTAYRAGTVSKVQTRFKTAYDERNLYFAVELDEPDMTRLSERSNLRRNSEEFWLNDSVEFCIVNDPKLQTFYKLIVSSAGKVQEIILIDDNTGRGVFTPFFEWKSHADVKTVRLKDKWLVEAAVPFGSLCRNDGNAWRINLNRNRHAVTPMELSSFARVTGSASIQQYPQINLPELDEKKYQWEVLNVTGKVSKSKGVLTYDVFADLVNRTGNFRIVKSKASLLDSEFKNILSVSLDDHLQDGKFSRLKFPLAPVVPGKYFLSLDCFSLDGTLLKTLLQKVRLEYQPVIVRLLRPAYRNNLYATMPDKTIEAEIALDGVASPMLKAVLKDTSGKIFEQKNIDAKKLPLKIVFDGGKLPDGAYFLEVSTDNGITAGQRLRKLPFRAGEVWLDKDGITHVEGERYLPYGWFIFQLNDKTDPCFNSHLTYNIGYPSMEKFHENVKAYEKRGMKTIPFPFQEFTGQDRWKTFAHATRCGAMNEEQKEQLKKTIPEMSKNSAILAWYFADEPESRNGNNPQWFIQANEWMAELDPYHPNLMLNWGPQGMRQFYEGCDILMPDCYIQYFENGRTTKPRWAISEWMKTAAELKRPAWLVPQAFPWGTVPPTLDDFRAEIYQAIVHNCKGFQLYNYAESRMHSSLTIAPGAVGAELMRIKDLVLENTLPGAVQVKTPPGTGHFQAGLKTWKGQYCLIAVNTSMKKITVEFTLERKLPSTLHVLGEKRSVSLKNGTFSDEFGPAETHVYLTDKATADSVEPLNSIRKRIANLRASRKKAGNWAGIGEVDDVRVYADYDKGKRPPHIPEIRASSDARLWFVSQYYKMNTLYFLLDGVTENSADYMIWSPAPNDKDPWIEITLPQEASVGKVVLHTPLDNTKKPKLSDAVVSVHDGQKFIRVGELKGNTVSAPEITFTPVKTKRIRIENIRLNKNNPMRAISEVEIFQSQNHL
ncbi:MAG: F5/8 type C domain protein [Lentisphaerae bacterium ADurb.Bin242]|nr:MAG: F5/8 type C domain protein [Lentisphaerae bacterium ADurb.Bin242]